jgi:hypothetical protein
MESLVYNGDGVNTIFTLPLSKQGVGSLVASLAGGTGYPTSGGILIARRISGNACQVQFNKIMKASEAVDVIVIYEI